MIDEKSISVWIAICASALALVYLCVTYWWTNWQEFMGGGCIQIGQLIPISSLRPSPRAGFHWPEDDAEEDEERINPKTPSYLQLLDFVPKRYILLRTVDNTGAVFGTQFPIGTRFRMWYSYWHDDFLELRSS
jgi:hypothetical protein